MDARGLLAGVIAVASAPACAAVLGVNAEPTDAVVAICGCPTVSKAVLDCEQTLTNRLAMATPDVRAAWLANYSSSDCTLCTNADHCLHTAPTCVASGNACSGPGECCSSSANPLTACDAHGLCK